MAIWFYRGFISKHPYCGSLSGGGFCTLESEAPFSASSGLSAVPLSDVVRPAAWGVQGAPNDLPNNLRQGLQLPAPPHRGGKEMEGGREEREDRIDIELILSVVFFSEDGLLVVQVAFGGHKIQLHICSAFPLHCDDLCAGDV